MRGGKTKVASAAFLAKVLRMLDLERFKIAQADPSNGFAVALGELRNGRKLSHWIWFIFPQLRILGRSPTAQFFGFDDAEDAREFIRDDELSANLVSSMQVVSKKLEDGVPIEELMGSYTDSMKLVSCCTLFKYALEAEGSALAGVRENEILSLANRILQLADKGGFGECSITRKHLVQKEEFPASGKSTEDEV